MFTQMDTVQPSAAIMAMFPDATAQPPFSVLFPGPSTVTPNVPIPMVIDIAELTASLAGVQAQEATDRSTLNILLNETRDTLRPQMFAWAAVGFPAVYIVQSFTVSPPAICADGVARNVYDYTEYLLGKNMGEVVSAIQALCVGVQISYSFQGNILRIHVSKA